MIATTHFNHFICSTDKEHVVLDADANELKRLKDMGAAMQFCKMRELKRQSDDLAKRVEEMQEPEPTPTPTPVATDDELTPVES